jgi:hypothetical protein
MSNGTNLIGMCFPMLNPKGNPEVVFMFDPDMVECVLRQERKYPDKGKAFETLKRLRMRMQHCAVKRKSNVWLWLDTFDSNSSGGLTADRGWRELASL